MSAFIAVDIPDEVKGDYALVVMRLREFPSVTTWIDPRKAHLTLTFLGEIDDAQRAAVIACIDTLAVSPFTITTEQIGISQQKGGRVVVWAGVKCPEELTKAIADITKQLRGIPAVRKAKPFRANITLARFENVRSMDELEQAIAKINLPQRSWTVDALSVYQSELTNNGPVYTALHKKNL